MEVIILLLILLLDLNGFNVIITTSLLFHLFDRAKYLWKKGPPSFSSEGVFFSVCLRSPEKS